MSLALITQAWQHFPEGGAQLNVLQAIAEASNEQGSCYLKIAQIAQLARLSKAATKRALDELRKERWVLTSRMLGKGGKLVFQLNLPKLRRAHREIDPTDAVAIIEQREEALSSTHEGLRDRVSRREIAQAQNETANEASRNVEGDWTAEGFSEVLGEESEAAQASCEPDLSLQPLSLPQGSDVDESEEYKSQSSVIRASEVENEKSVTKSALLPETLQPAISEHNRKLQACIDATKLSPEQERAQQAFYSSSVSRQQDEEATRAQIRSDLEAYHAGDAERAAKEALLMSSEPVAVRSGPIRVPFRYTDQSGSHLPPGEVPAFGALADFNRENDPEDIKPVELLPACENLKRLLGLVPDGCVAGDVLTIELHGPQDDLQGAGVCESSQQEHLEPASASSDAVWEGFEPSSTPNRVSSRPARRFR